MDFTYYDVHSHLNLPQFDEDRDAVIARLKEAGIATITVGVDYETSQAAISLAEAHDNLFACVGLHPADNETEIFDIEKYRALAAHPKVLAIGECGLDYFRDQAPETKERQKNIFLEHIALAQAVGKPLMIHARPSPGSMDAYDDALDILERFPGIRANFHFFVGDVRVAERAASLGCTMSFDGPITFSRDYDEVIRRLGAGTFMAETDAPFAAPTPHRGRRNSPEYVPEVYRALAEIRGEDPEIARAAVNGTALRAFGFGR